MGVSLRQTPARSSSAQPPRSLRERLDRGFQYWALAPALLLILALTVYPLIDLLRMSVSTVAFTEGKILWTFSGLENLRTFLEDETFLIAIRNTVVFVIVTVVVEMLLGFTLALLVSQLSSWVSVSRAVLMVPILVPAIAIGTIWRLMYNFDFGIFNQLLKLVGLPPQNWNGSNVLALPSVMVVDIWHWTAFVFLLMLAGLESLPVEPMEAARVDGASNGQLLRYIILPLMRPTIAVALLFRTIFAFKVFDEVFLLTGGGPGNATEVISLYIHRVFFDQSRMGYGALLSVITIAVVGVFVVIYSRVNNARRSA